MIFMRQAHDFVSSSIFKSYFFGRFRTGVPWGPRVRPDLQLLANSRADQGQLFPQPENPQELDENGWSPRHGLWIVHGIPGGKPLENPPTPLWR